MKKHSPPTHTRLTLLLLILSLIFSSQSFTLANPFQDTSENNIVKAYQLGIVNGVSATQFDLKAKSPASTSQ